MLGLASTVTYAENTQNSGSRQAGEACGDDYKPVCARTRSNIVATYSNNCIAVADGAIVIYEVACRTELQCSFIYRPICARKLVANEQKVLTHVLVPYFNKCAAEKDTDENNPNGAVPLTIKGEQFPERKITDPRQVVNIENVCPRSQDDCGPAISDPKKLVCASDKDGVPRLYRNKCLAVFAGADPHKYNNLSPCDRPASTK
jgi:hypothetical protein